MSIKIQQLSRNSTEIFCFIVMEMFLRLICLLFNILRFYLLKFFVLLWDFFLWHLTKSAREDFVTQNNFTVCIFKKENTNCNRKLTLNWKKKQTNITSFKKFIWLLNEWLFRSSRCSINNCFIDLIIQWISLSIICLLKKYSCFSLILFNNCFDYFFI